MIKKAVSLVAAVAAIAAAAGVCVVALAYALFAVARTYLGPAGGAAVVAAAAALVAIVVAMVLFRKARPSHRPAPVEEQSFTTRLIDLARDKPILATGVAVAAGLVLMRNPKLMTTIVTAAMASKAGKAAGRAEERRR